MFAASKTDSVSASVPEDKFNYVTMLLHGDGTNGAQNNTFVDSSTNNFTITRNGNTTQGSFSPYGSNWSNYFNGSTDYLRYAGQSAFSFGTGDFTIEGWFFVNSLASGILAWDFRNSGGTNGAFPTLELSTNGQVQYFSDSAYRISSSSGLLTANTWAHIAITRSGTSTKLFFNGTQAGSTYSDSTNYTVGAGGPYIGSGSAPSAYLTGYISNFRVVKGTAVYTSNFTPSTTPLTAITNTSLLTCQSNRFIDNSANNFTATIGGTPSVQRFNPFGTATAYSTSVIGGSGYFDGSGDYLVTSGTGSFNPRSTFTVEFWTYPISNSTITWINSNTNNSFYFETSGTTLFVGDGLINTINTTAPTVNQWTQLLLSFDGTTYRLFYNGVLQASSTSLLQSAVITAFRIGQKQDGTRDFNGYITDMRVLVGTALYTSAFTPPTAPITAITNTSLLLNYTNGAIFDNAMMNDLETVGNAQISTSVKKYGTGSMYFDGTGDGLFTVSKPNLAFGTGDFTVEFWLYLAANLNTFAKVVMMGTTGNCFTIEAQGTANVLNLTNLTSTVYVTSSTALTTGTWIHVAATRASGTLRLFQNGTQVGSAANTVDFPNTGGIYIGRSNTGQETNGYIDDLRITKGYARYTANFTAPTSALSDTGPI